MNVDISETDGDEIHLVVKGEGGGELIFRSYSAFREFLNKCSVYMESYEFTF